MPNFPTRTLDPLSLMSRELGRLMRTQRRTATRPAATRRPTAWGVPVNLTETADGYRLRAAVSGVAPEALDISVEGRTVTLRVTRPGVEHSGRRVLGERGIGDVTRRFQLARDVDADAITARYELGVLDVTLPFAAGPRRIEIQQG